MRRDVSSPSLCSWATRRLYQCGRHSPEPGLEYPVSLNRLFPWAQVLLTAVLLIWSTVSAHGACVCLSEKYYFFVWLCHVLCRSEFAPLSLALYWVILGSLTLSLHVHHELLLGLFTTAMKYVCMVVRIYVYLKTFAVPSSCNLLGFFKNFFNCMLKNHLISWDTFLSVASR